MFRKFLGPRFDAERSALSVRCFAEAKGDHWVAVCLEFCLAVQGDSADEVKQKLHAQIEEYVYDAVLGEDRAHARQLMSRHAPLSFYARYYMIKWGMNINVIRRIRDGLARTFKDDVTYEPRIDCHA